MGKEIEKGSHQADLTIMPRTLGTIEIPLWKLVNSTERAHKVFAADAKVPCSRSMVQDKVWSLVVCQLKILISPRLRSSSR